MWRALPFFDLDSAPLRCRACLSLNHRSFPFPFLTARVSRCFNNWRRKWMQMTSLTWRCVTVCDLVWAKGVDHAGSFLAQRTLPLALDHPRSFIDWCETFNQVRFPWNDFGRIGCRLGHVDFDLSCGWTPLTWSLFRRGGECKVGKFNTRFLSAAPNFCQELTWMSVFDAVAARWR